MKVFVRFGPLVFLVLSVGCAGPQYYRYLPDDTTEMRKHPLGMAVYNQSGEALEESYWEQRFSVIAAAYRAFKECVGEIPPDADDELRHAPLVVFPEGPIRFFGYDRPAAAFNDLKHVFLAKNYFDADSLMAEWAYIYLYVTGKSWFFGDLFHKHPIFQKCRYA